MGKLKGPELLAPAGNLDKLKFAFIYGADAVYLGGRSFNLRAHARNFSFSDLKKARTFADHNKKKIYLAVNTYLYNQDFKKLDQYLAGLLKTGLRNIIVSDLGAVHFINKNFKKEFHISLSTQANTTNYYTIDLLQEIGVDRIILARELNLQEISEIRKKSSLELEAFIHGAMCVSYSGRCLLSEYMTQRSANKGDCTQPCRWEYYLKEKTRADEFFPVEEDEHGTYILSSKDLMTLNILKKIIRTGLDSLKIEGRMKSIYYVANVTRVYRKALDTILSGRRIDLPYLMTELESVSHRPYYNGFFIKNNRSIVYNKTYQREYQFLGYIKKPAADGLYQLEVKNSISKEDEIEIITPDFRDILKPGFKLYNKNKQPVSRAVINDLFYIDLDTQNIPDYSILRKRS